MSSQLDDVVALRSIFRRWWPLAASWLFMGLELPLLSAVVARMPDATVHLAAYGGIVFPLALLIEAPVIMLLAASTALSRDLAAYRALRGVTHRMGLALTVLHALIAFTPAFDVVMSVMDAPPAIVEPARTGFRIMLPWTWSIASRRFQQGVLIRFGASRAVGIGTLVRLTANALTLALMVTLGSHGGIVVATSAVAIGVLSEAAYTAWRVRAFVRGALSNAAPSEAILRGRAFVRFYLPLALMPLITLVALPLGSAAMGRMPHTLESLAVWPALHGVVFLLQSFGMAYNEVVVATLHEPRSAGPLRAFAMRLAAVMTLATVLLITTPLAWLWFARGSGLPPNLTALAIEGLAWSAILPAMAAMQSWFQGVLVHARNTRPIIEAVGVFLCVCVIVSLIGIVRGTMVGITVTMIAFALGRAAQTGWLWLRSRHALLDDPASPRVA